MNQQVDEQGNLSLIFQNATEGDCVQGAMGWKKVDGKLTPDCTNCGCPVSYQCGPNNRCVSLLNLQAPAAPVGVTCLNGQVLNESFVCVDCEEPQYPCGQNMFCSSGHCCPSYTPFWNGTKCTCASGSEGGCSSIMPWRCNEDGSFLPNCEVCGCPPDYDCRENVCREKPGASLRKVQIPDLNPIVALLTLFSFLFFFKKK
jgi:hypothetical protein